MLYSSFQTSMLKRRPQWEPEYDDVGNFICSTSAAGCHEFVAVPALECSDYHITNLIYRTPPCCGNYFNANNCGPSVRCSKTNILRTNPSALEACGGDSGGYHPNIDNSAFTAYIEQNDKPSNCSYDYGSGPEPIPQELFVFTALCAASDGDCYGYEGLSAEHPGCNGFPSLNPMCSIFTPCGVPCYHDPEYETTEHWCFHLGGPLPLSLPEGGTCPGLPLFIKPCPAPTSSPTTSAPTSSPTTSAPTSSPTTSTPTSSPTTSAPTSSPTTSVPTSSPTTSSPTQCGKGSNMGKSSSSCGSTHKTKDSPSSARKKDGKKASSLTVGAVSTPTSTSTVSVTIIVAMVTVTVAAVVMTRAVYRRTNALIDANIDEVSTIGEIEWDETTV